MNPCFCGSQKSSLECCSEYIGRNRPAPTPEKLMRSRYTAFVLGQLDYIEKTMKGPALENFNRLETKRWLSCVKWLELKIYNSEFSFGTRAYVEFEAFFIENQRITSIHEKSEFLFENGHWFYVNGIHLPKTQLIKKHF